MSAVARNINAANVAQSTTLRIGPRLDGERDRRDVSPSDQIRRGGGGPRVLVPDAGGVRPGDEVAR